MTPTDLLAKLRLRLDDYYAPDEIDMWLSLPHPQLNGATPQSCIDSGRSDEVSAIIDHLDAGVYL